MRQLRTAGNATSSGGLQTQAPTDTATLVPVAWAGELGDSAAADAAASAVQQMNTTAGGVSATPEDSAAPLVLLTGSRNLHGAVGLEVSPGWNLWLNCVCCLSCITHQVHYPE